jgi:hypothetical protein
MEDRFESDFSDVRICRGTEAAASAWALGADAYTVGNRIMFAPGRYDPGSARGQRVLAHELAHVVQQRSGPVSGLPIGGDVTVSHPEDTFEVAAENKAHEIMTRSGTAGAARAARPADGMATRAGRSGLYSAPRAPVSALSVQRNGRNPRNWTREEWAAFLEKHGNLAAAGASGLAQILGYVYPDLVPYATGISNLTWLGSTLGPYIRPRPGQAEVSPASLEEGLQPTMERPPSLRGSLEPGGEPESQAVTRSEIDIVRSHISNLYQLILGINERLGGLGQGR